jgi:hypothetical protein
MTLVLRDTIPIHLYIVTEQYSEVTKYAVSDIEALHTISFGAKAALTDAEFDVSENTWTPVGSGTDKYYSANVELNTAELIAAIGDLNTITLKAEFTIVSPTGANQLSTQFDLTINRDVIVGTEGIISGNYTVIIQYQDDDGGQGVRIINAAGTQVGLFKNGSPYVFCETTGLWYPLTAREVDGIVVPGYGEGVLQ